MRSVARKLVASRGGADGAVRPFSRFALGAPAGGEVIGEVVGEIACTNPFHRRLQIVLHPDELDVLQLLGISSRTYPARQSPSFGLPTDPVLMKWIPCISRCHGL